MQPLNVLDEDWDHLLVLDACRYDVFAGVYAEYLDGHLEKRRSPASATPEWAAKTFTGTHDLAYFSANPFINGIDVALNETQWGASCGYDWTAIDHIAEIFDVWQTGWDDDLGTVPPERVNEAVRANPDAIARRDRTVVHYMQPHAPFIVGGKGRKLSQIRDGLAAEAGGGHGDGGGVLSAVGDAVRPRIERRLANSELAMKLGMLVELNPRNLLSVGRNGTRDTVERYYEQNLRLALEAVVDLLEDLDGRVVVTSDHGEAFGEDGVWEHHIETHIPALVEVPWLVVES